MTEKEIEWDLTEIFSGHDDPKITESIDSITKKATEFISDYKGKINSAEFTPKKLLDLFKKQEDFQAEVSEEQMALNKHAGEIISEYGRLKNFKVEGLGNIKNN